MICIQQSPYDGGHMVDFSFRYWRPWRHPNRCSLMQFKQGEDGNYIVDEAKTKAKQDAAREEAKGGRCCGANRTDEEIEKIAMAHWNTVYETERCQCGWQISQEDHDLGNYPNGKISPCVERLLFQEAVAFNHRPYEQTPSTMVMSTISQDSGFWDGLFGTCCCARCGVSPNAHFSVHLHPVHAHLSPPMGIAALPMHVLSCMSPTPTLYSNSN